MSYILFPVKCLHLKFDPFVASATVLSRDNLPKGSQLITTAVIEVNRQGEECAPTGVTIGEKEIGWNNKGR